MSETIDRGESPTGGRSLTRGRALALAGLVLTLLFAAGMAMGIVIERRLLPHGPRSGDFRREGGARGGPGGRAGRNMMRERLVKDLGLDSVQAARLDSIFERHRPVIDSVRAAMEARLSSVVEQTRREIDSVLTPEQRTKMHERWEHEDERRGGRRGPPFGEREHRPRD